MSINLEKGQKISLEKKGTKLNKIAFGSGWGMKKTERSGFLGIGKGSKESSVDLDASCVMLDKNKQLVDTVWFRQKRSKCTSVQHSGDDQNGGGDKNEPNEIIKVDLAKIPANVETLVFTINSFSGDSFEGIPHAFAVISDLANNSEFARFHLAEVGGRHTALVLAKVYRNQGSWKVHAMGEQTSGRIIEDIINFVQEVI